MQIDEIEASILREMGSKLLAGCSFKEIAYWATSRDTRPPRARCGIR
jgi:hypothetical protein